MGRKSSATDTLVIDKLNRRQRPQKPSKSNAFYNNLMEIAFEAHIHDNLHTDMYVNIAMYIFAYLRVQVLVK